MNILTRGDFDGMTSCVLLKEVEEIGEIRFAHPKDVQDGKATAGPDDIVVNIPYIPGCGMWFDHHAHREGRLPEPAVFKGRFEIAPSCARVIANHYAGRAGAFDRFAELLADTDRLDSGQLTPEDVTDPRGGILLGITLDPRSGVGGDFREYFRWMVDRCGGMSVGELLETPEVRARADAVLNAQRQYRDTLTAHSRVDGPVVLVDFRGLAGRPVGSRFLIYTMYTDCNVEVRVFKGPPGQTIAAVGHSIFNRTCRVSAGALCARYGGGGHKGAGTCQFPDGEAERVIAEIVAALKANGPLDPA